MIQTLNSLLPLALLVGLGAALLRLRFFDDAFRKGLDRLVYWVALPALIVGVLAEAPSAGVLGAAGPMALTLCTATAVMALLAWVVAKGMRLPAAATGVFSQATFRGNLAFVGVPVITLAVAGRDGGADTLAKAALVFAPTTVLFNLLAVTVLVAAQHKLDARLPLRLLKSMAQNPLLLACITGLVIWTLRVELPPVALTTLDLLGQPAAPLALISLGGALATYPVGRHLGTAGLATALKCAALPALAWLLAGWFGVAPDDRLVVLIFAASPTAVSSYVLASQLKGDAALAAAAIVVSTVTSAISLAVILAWA